MFTKFAKLKDASNEFLQALFDSIHDRQRGGIRDCSGDLNDPVHIAHRR